MNTPKRCRGSNFTTEEELMLVEEVMKYKDQIECKTTNKVSNEEKEEAWKCVLNAFNAKSLRSRSIEQIKSKFDNLKSKARKVVAAEKSYIKGTGGGKYRTSYTGNPVIEAVLQVINFKTVVGLQSSFDCDTIVFDVGPTDFEFAKTSEPVDVAYTVLHAEQQAPSTSCVDQSIAPPCAVNVPSVVALEEIVPPNSGGQIKVLREVQVEKQACSKSDSPANKENWSTYIPSKLKRKAHSKLRPTISNPAAVAKEAYYRRKMELLEAAEEREAAERVNKSRREEEEHVKKMTLLELEIEIKKKQLL